MNNKFFQKSCRNSENDPGDFQWFSPRSLGFHDPIWRVAPNRGLAMPPDLTSWFLWLTFLGWDDFWVRNVEVFFSVFCAKIWGISISILLKRMLCYILNYIVLYHNYHTMLIILDIIWYHIMLHCITLYYIILYYIILYYIILYYIIIYYIILYYIILSYISSTIHLTYSILCILSFVFCIKTTLEYIMYHIRYML